MDPIFEMPPESMMETTPVTESSLTELILNCALVDSHKLEYNVFS